MCALTSCTLKSVHENSNVEGNKKDHFSLQELINTLESSNAVGPASRHPQIVNLSPGKVHGAFDQQNLSALKHNNIFISNLTGGLPVKNGASEDRYSKAPYVLGTVLSVTVNEDHRHFVIVAGFILEMYGRG